jgi:DNA-binding cell septation regulator SpoVG
MTIDDINIKIFLARVKSDTAAYVKLTFPIEIDGALAPITVGNFRVMNSHFSGKSHIVRPPAMKASDGTYKTIFFLNNEELWYRLERKILDEYSKLMRREMLDGESKATS